jgi:hypothetical protein
MVMGSSSEPFGNGVDEGVGYGSVEATDIAGVDVETAAGIGASLQAASANKMKLVRTHFASKPDN